MYKTHSFKLMGNMLTFLPNFLKHTPDDTGETLAELIEIENYATMLLLSNAVKFTSSFMTLRLGSANVSSLYSSIHLARLCKMD